MSGFSTHLAHALMNHVFRGTAYTAPASTYLALATADLTDDNLTANEIDSATHTWYARQEITSWTAPSAGVSSNSNQIQFTPVSGTSITISHWGIYDAATSGNLLASGALNDSKTLNVDDIYTLAENEIELTWD